MSETKEKFKFDNSENKNYVIVNIEYEKNLPSKEELIQDLKIIIKRTNEIYHSNNCLIEKLKIKFMFLEGRNLEDSITEFSESKENCEEKDYIIGRYLDLKRLNKSLEKSRTITTVKLKQIENL